MNTIFRNIIILSILLLGYTDLFSSDFYLINQKEALKIYIVNSEKSVVNTASNMFSDDLQFVSGVKPILVDAIENAQLIVGAIGDDVKFDNWLKKENISTKDIIGEWEAFKIQIIETRGKPILLVLGSDPRGTAYGLLELSRMIGVSPWCWWADVVPEKKNSVYLPANFIQIQKPSVQYRGIFLNDEDWGLLPWSKNTFEPHTETSLGVKTYEKVFELLLRLRANTLWPAMHGVSTPFYFIDGTKEMADRYGIVIGTSHCEPLMRNTNGEWKVSGVGEYNYLTNKENIKNFWKERLREVNRYENIYTIGMRGVHDGKMQGAETLDEQRVLLSEAIKDQRSLLSTELRKNAETIPQVFMPYKEVLDVYNNGLSAPDDVTLVWCDDNYGYITKLSDKKEQKRKGGSGVYYHISYFGKPHDYLWLCTTQPGIIYSEMKRAWEHGAKKMWILNAGDIKPGEYHTEFFLDLAWNINSINHNTIYAHLKNWLSREFGNGVVQDLSFVMNEHYRLAAIRKPEHMGFNRTQEYAKTKNRGGATDVEDTDFNPFMFGDEVQSRINSYLLLEKIVLDSEKLISKEKKDAYFQLIKYPVLAAKAMNLKLLYAQKVRLFESDDPLVAKEYAEKSINAYNEIAALTMHYNKLIADGKWDGMMDMQPRKLPVFGAPILSSMITDANSESAAIQLRNRKDTSSENQIIDVGQKTKIESHGMVAWNASSFERAGKIYEIQGLGHSMSAVVLPKGEELVYEIYTSSANRAKLILALIPTHAVNGGDLRCEVKVDGEQAQIISFKTDIGSEEWKKNVLRSQSLGSINQTIKRAGKHTIHIKALDDNIIIDQLMLDFDQERKFYQIPTEILYTK